MHPYTHSYNDIATPGRLVSDDKAVFRAKYQLLQLQLERPGVLWVHWPHTLHWCPRQYRRHKRAIKGMQITPTGPTLGWRGEIRNPMWQISYLHVRVNSWACWDFSWEWWGLIVRMRLRFDRVTVLLVRAELITFPEALHLTIAAPGHGKTALTVTLELARITRTTVWTEKYNNMLWYDIAIHLHVGRNNTTITHNSICATFNVWKVEPWNWVEVRNKVVCHCNVSLRELHWLRQLVSTERHGLACNGCQA